MPDLPVLVLLGAVCGLIASAVMEAYQTIAARPFGQTGGGDSSTVKFADMISSALTGEPVTQKRRALAGRVVHYVTGSVLGVIYVVVAAIEPDVAILFGVAYGVVVAIVLDYVVVPTLGLGPPAWKTPFATHLYGLTAHMVFGASLEAARRIGFLLF
ncbi:hypothetical protein ASG11_01335 [Sphingomonas sp. Leaf357]|uniref:DUF1440 domain-containing protein n=1 Tax=Sphingomonas sp. Leaf357 TaxID=1736350 RepID=UPI0006F7FEB3|nr:DUF1440 domain-containing protein [Sphingomonas sp. Leaf357]KQS03072.1 hypothetical protein ASG11_01335 [Sphingomonas sp. Leaf357]